MSSDECRGRVSCCVIIPIALVCIVIVGCLLALRSGTVPTQPTLPEVSEVAHLKFSRNARLLNSYGIGFRDYIMLAKVQVRTDDFWTTLQSLPAKCDKSSSDKLGIDKIGYDVPRWWNPDSVKSFLAFRTHAARDDATVWVLATKNKQTMVLYVCVVTD